MSRFKRLKQYLYKVKNNFWTFDILKEYSKVRNRIVFIQIGSNDGKHGDPIREHIEAGGWNGILVEPVPYLFARLRQNYSEVQNILYFENSAIATQSGKLPFYRLAQSDYPDLPEWYDQLGSFDKNVLLKHEHTMPHFKELFTKDEVNAITFSDLIEKYNIQTVNLIHIDTEGFDYEILKMIPFEKLSPDILLFEHKHLSQEDYAGAVKLLSDNHFIVRKKTQHDIIAIKKPILKEIKSNKKSSSEKIWFD